MHVHFSVFCTQSTKYLSHDVYCQWVSSEQQALNSCINSSLGLDASFRSRHYTLATTFNSHISVWYIVYRLILIQPLMLMVNLRIELTVCLYIQIHTPWCTTGSWYINYLRQPGNTHWPKDELRLFFVTVKLFIDRSYFTTLCSHLELRECIWLVCLYFI